MARPTTTMTSTAAMAMTTTATAMQSDGGCGPCRSASEKVAVDGD